MLFNSWGYILFLMLSIPMYWIIPHRYRSWLLALLSVGFYAMWKPEFSLLMLFSAFVDYFVAQRIFDAESTKKKAWLLISLIVNLGLLVFFKYTYFIYDNVSSVFGNDGQLSVSIILPLGISFYTFQTISYSIDVYRGIQRPVKNVADFVTYVTFWPQLIAGPILRSGEVIPQLIKKHQFRLSHLAKGMERVIYGLFKKVVLADNIAPLVDKIYAGDAGLFNLYDSWVAAFLFGFQIYFDFSGYSDIAIGSARMLGIRFPENFNWPYFATSPKDLWKRWHISLSSWIRDYLYLPLTGQKFHHRSTGGIAVASQGKTGFALFATWFIMGLWHGAAWNFAMWGVYHALLIAAFRLVPSFNKLPNVINWGVMLFLSMAGWVFFRAESETQAVQLFANLFDVSRLSFAEHALHKDVYLAVVFLLLGMTISFTVKRSRVSLPNAFADWGRFVLLSGMTVFIMIYLKIVNQFIYFQF